MSDKLLLLPEKMHLIKRDFEVNSFNEEEKKKLNDYGLKLARSILKNPCSMPELKIIVRDSKND